MRFRLLILLVTIAGVLNAQTYALKGKIADDFQNPIDQVGCVLQSLTDTLFSQGTVTDANGVFELEGFTVAHTHFT